MVLSSCTQIPSSESVTPTAKFPVELPFTPAATGSIPTAYPILTNTSTAVPVATVPSKRLYTDPGNWYSLSIPIEWKATNNPNAFSGGNGFFETGYLPEMAFMPHEMNVCQWLANIDSQATYSISFMESNRCILTSLPGILPAAVQVIIKNPAADDDQRFFYVKTDPDHYFEILGSFAWLRSTNLLTPPASRPATLRPADASFWEKAAPMPPGFSVEEHKLPQEAQNKKPSQNIFPRSLRPLATPEKPNVDLIVSNTWEAASQQMKPFGYELEPASLAHLWQLYKNGGLLLDNIYARPIIYRVSTPSGEKIAFLVHTINDPNQPFYAPHNAAGYLIWNDAIILWGEAPQNLINSGLSPILYQDDLLWLQAEPNTILLHVKNSQRDTLFTFATYFGANLPVREFTTWNGHWILEVSDFVILDGEILNKKLGFEQVFGWRVIHDKPFYFFRKGSRIGISYNGQFFSIYYQEVAHGLCCGLMSNNPEGDQNSLQFLGKRDGVWYDVSVIMKSP